jgi:4-oxalocrotonate tautomerase
MPHVIIKMFPGPSERAKQQLAAAITKDVMRHASVGEESVSVSIEEVGPSEWMEKVYRPDISAKRALLYKEPGYEPF